LLADLDNAVARPDGQPALERQSKQSSRPPLDAGNRTKTLTGIPIAAEHIDSVKERCTQ